MAIVFKNKEIATGARANVYVKINSIRAGQGEGGKITCNCSEWLSKESRDAEDTPYRANVDYHIDDVDINASGYNLIQAVYPNFQKHFEKAGYEVEEC